MIYSGVSEGRAKGGVAVIISAKSKDCLSEWMCVRCGSHSQKTVRKT